jgi:hypothetical protein
VNEPKECIQCHKVREVKAIRLGKEGGPLCADCMPVVPLEKIRAKPDGTEVGLMSMGDIKKINAAFDAIDDLRQRMAIVQDLREAMKTLARYVLPSIVRGDISSPKPGVLALEEFAQLYPEVMK